MVSGSIRVAAWVASVISEIPLYMCTTPYQHCFISLLHEQGHTAEVLRAKLGLGLVEVIENLYLILIQ